MRLPDEKTGNTTKLETQSNIEKLTLPEEKIIDSFLDAILDRIENDRNVVFLKKIVIRVAAQIEEKSS